MSKLDSLDSSVTPAITLIEGIVENESSGWRRLENNGSR